MADKKVKTVDVSLVKISYREYTKIIRGVAIKSQWYGNFILMAILLAVFAYIKFFGDGLDSNVILYWIAIFMLYSLMGFGITIRTMRPGASAGSAKMIGRLTIYSGILFIVSLFGIINGIMMIYYGIRYTSVNKFTDEEWEEIHPGNVFEKISYKQQKEERKMERNKAKRDAYEARNKANEDK